MKTFCASSLEDQRKILERKSREVVEAHVEVLFLLSQYPAILSYILPNLDGILYECPTASSHIYDIIEKNPNRNVIQKLQKIIASKDNSYNTVIMDSTARLMAFLISDHKHYHLFIEDVRIFINFLVSSGLKTQKGLSDYLMVVCLSHVLLVPGMSQYFIKISGMQLLKEVLKKCANDLQVMYYAF